MAILLSMSYIRYDKYSREQTGDVIIFLQFEKWNLLSETQSLLSETRDNKKSGNEFDDDLTMPPLISE